MCTHLTNHAQKAETDISDVAGLVFHGKRRHRPPVWSPDGRFLITRPFPLRGPDVVPSLWLIDLESGALRHLLEPGDFPAFAP